MGFNVTFQTNSSEDNRVDKTLTNIFNKVCVLKNDTEIINPTLVINANISAMKNVNYFTINELGRSYFVKSIKSIRNGVVEVVGHCDVLSSNKTALRSNTAIISRNESKYNLYLDDGTFRTYSNPHILTRKFPAGFSDCEFVLAVAGR